jgi:hypothetical protein
MRYGYSDHHKWGHHGKPYFLAPVMLILGLFLLISLLKSGILPLLLIGFLIWQLSKSSHWHGGHKHWKHQWKAMKHYFKEHKHEWKQEWERYMHDNAPEKPKRGWSDDTPEKPKRGWSESEGAPEKPKRGSNDIEYI